MENSKIITIHFDKKDITVEVMEALVIEVLLDFKKENLAVFFRVPLDDAMSFFGFQDTEQALLYMKKLLMELQNADHENNYEEFPVYSVEKLLGNHKSMMKRLKFRYHQN